MKMTKVSRNTLLEDMKQLKEALLKQEITLRYQAASGYVISGDERVIRLALKPYIHFIRTMIKTKNVSVVLVKGTYFIQTGTPSPPAVRTRT